MKSKYIYTIAPHLEGYQITRKETDPESWDLEPELVGYSPTLPKAIEAVNGFKHLHGFFN